MGVSLSERSYEYLLGFFISSVVVVLSDSLGENESGKKSDGEEKVIIECMHCLRNRIEERRKEGKEKGDQWSDRRREKKRSRRRVTMYSHTVLQREHVSLQGNGTRVRRREQNLMSLIDILLQADYSFSFLTHLGFLLESLLNLSSRISCRYSTPWVTLTPCNKSGNSFSHHGDSEEIFQHEIRKLREMLDDKYCDGSHRGKRYAWLNS